MNSQYLIARLGRVRTYISVQHYPEARQDLEVLLKQDSYILEVRYECARLEVTTEGALKSGT